MTTMEAESIWFYVILVVKERSVTSLRVLYQLPDSGFRFDHRLVICLLCK
jgi:hypothetical protein